MLNDNKDDNLSNKSKCGNRDKVGPRILVVLALMMTS